MAEGGGQSTGVVVEPDVHNAEAARPDLSAFFEVNLLSHKRAAARRLPTIQILWGGLQQVAREANECRGWHAVGHRDGYSGGGGGFPPKSPPCPPDDEMTMTKRGQPILANFHHF